MSVPPGAVRYTPQRRAEVDQATSSLEGLLGQLLPQHQAPPSTPPRAWADRQDADRPLRKSDGPGHWTALGIWHAVGGGRDAFTPVRGSGGGDLEMSFPLAIGRTPTTEPAWGSAVKAERPSSARLQRRQTQREAEARTHSSAAAPVSASTAKRRETDEIRRGLRAASYTMGGEDWQKLLARYELLVQFHSILLHFYSMFPSFVRYEPQRGAGLRPEDFAAAVRRHVKAAEGMRERDMQLLFAQIDKNASGYIEADEWAAFLRGSASGPAVGGTPTVAKAGLNGSISKAGRPGARGASQGGGSAAGDGELVIPTGHARVGVIEQVPIGKNRAPLQQVYQYFMQRQAAAVRSTSRGTSARLRLAEPEPAVGMTQESFMQFWCESLSISTVLA